MITFLAISLMPIAILTTILAMRYRSLMVSARKLSEHNRACCDAREAELSRIQGISHNFLAACRLIAIHRNGRMNVWTFSRGDQMFTIETMGVYADNPAEWRQLAGLDQQQ